MRRGTVMGTGRLEAFSDGVIAIILTIMVLSIGVPHSVEWSALASLWPALLSYLLSFIFVGIYWNNHHHMLQASKEVSGGILWANLHLLFWLSLVPFTTAWMGENHFAPLPVSAYGVVLFMAAAAYYILAQMLVARHGRGSTLAVALGKDVKGVISLLCYGVAIPMAFYFYWVSLLLYITVALMWLVPDRRIEEKMTEEAKT